MADNVELVRSVARNETNGSGSSYSSNFNGANIGGAINSALGLTSSLLSKYNSVQNADNYVGQLQGQVFDPNTGYGLQEAKNAFLGYTPIKYASTKDFGYNGDSFANGLGYLGAALNGYGTGNNLGGGVAGGIGAAVGALAYGVTDYLSRKKATEEVNKYNAAVGKTNAFNYATLLSNLENAKYDTFYNSVYNSLKKGGPLSTQGADWNTGLNYIGNGGSHEQNPYGGIQQGIAPDGLPNLVEEGEVIWNGDYVFSKRLKVPKAFREKFKLGEESISYADAALKFDEEMNERPNDPISKRGRDSMLAKLAAVQEEKRNKIADKEQQEDMLQGIQPMIATNGGAIHIDKNKRGTFTAAASRHGKSVQEFASQILANPDNYSPAIRKKANFARNAAKWHSNGGHLFPLGGEYLNWLKGLTSNDYAALINNIGGKALNYRNNPEGLFNFANLGKSGPVYEGLQNAYMYSNPPGLNSPLHPEIERGINIPEPLTISPSRLSKLEDIGEGMYTVPDANGNISFVLNSQNKKESSTPISKNKSNSSWLTGLRYAPVIGSAIGAIDSLFSKPDYRNADAIAGTKIRNVSFSPLGNYARYKPVDTRFALNQLNAAASATRRALVNQAAGNRGTAMASLLAADNNYINSIGNMLFSAENSNYERYLKTLAHNTDIDKANREGALKAAMANQGADEVRMRAAQVAAQMREAIDQRIGAARSANLTNFFDNLGNIGREEFMLNSINSNNAWNYLLGRDGILDYKGYPVANGGYITIKNKRRRK